MSEIADEWDLARLLEIAVFAARAGGDVVRRAYDTAPEGRAKGRGDWVSDVDHTSEQVVRDVLVSAAPGLAFLGEESGGSLDAPGWVVDPLDGTTNFLRRLPAVGVSIAFVAGGRPLVGVVYAPMLDETYTASRGGGAHRDGVPVRVADRKPARAICATGFPFREHQLERFGEYKPVLDRALDDFEDLRRVGAASLDLAWTASGSLDGYFELGLGQWDVAAGALLVEEAGGVITDWSGDPLAWLSSGDIVAGSPAVHTRLLEIIAATR